MEKQNMGTEVALEYEYEEITDTGVVLRERGVFHGRIQL
jgi:hypothetical protein